MEEILRAVNKYAEGIKKVEERREKWLKKSVWLKEYLGKIAAFLNEKGDYKPGYYTDVYYPYNEQISGNCFHIPSIGFRSGNMPIGVIFENKAGSINVFTERGFEVIFNPVITGQVVVSLYPHVNDFEKNESAMITLNVIDDPDLITEEQIDQVIMQAIEIAYHTSYAGMADHNGNDIKARTPIGFKREAINSANQQQSITLKKSI